MMGQNIQLFSKVRHTAFMLALAAALAALVLYSATRGASEIAWATILDSVTAFDAQNMQHLIVRDIRIPRTLASMFVGAALAVAGAIMQGITANPMADSGLMGLNAGAGFALAVSFAFFPKATYLAKVLVCFGGAAMGAAMVNGVALAGTRAPSPMRLVLSGAAVSMLLSALSQGVALTFGVAQDMMFWTVGGVAASTWQQLRILVPVVLAALAAAMLMAERISLIALGDQTATGLGVNVTAAKLICSAVVVAMAGAAVSIVGAVGFVGLIVPHVARFCVGADYRKIIPCSAICGALLVVTADILSKTLNPPTEIPLGALTALVGVPFFLILARRERRQ